MTDMPSRSYLDGSLEEARNSPPQVSIVSLIAILQFFSNDEFEGGEKDLSKDLVVSSRTGAFLVLLEGWPDIDFVKLEAINGVRIKIINLA